MRDEDIESSSSSHANMEKEESRRRAELIKDEFAKRRKVRRVSIRDYRLWLLYREEKKGNRRHRCSALTSKSISSLCRFDIFSRIVLVVSGAVFSGSSARPRR